MENLAAVKTVATSVSEEAAALVMDVDSTQKRVTGELRSLIVLCVDGTIVVSEKHRSDPAVDSAISYLREHWAPHARNRKLLPVPLETLNAIRNRTGGVRRPAAADSKTVEYARSLIAEAFRANCSDIHIRIHKRYGYGEILFRIDGDLVKMPEKQLKVSEADELVTAIYQVMSEGGDGHYNPSAHQGARIGFTSGHLPDGLQSVRVQSSPKLGGTIMVLRLLYDENFPGRTVGEKTLNLGFEPVQSEALAALAAHSEGVTLVTGPTGAGKSTTLFAILDAIITTEPELNVMTAEDPPEYEKKEIVQLVVVNSGGAERRQAAYQEAINAILREDPDVIMIGECRDRESAGLTITAANTGHLVFTTIHTNSAWEAIDRMCDLLPEDKRTLVFNPNVLRGLHAQRLVKKLCPKCSVLLTSKKDAFPTTVLVRIHKALNGDVAKVRLPGPGCQHCASKRKAKGYKGRTVIAEVVQTTPHLLEIARTKGTQAAREQWIADGGISMLQHGLMKLMRGEIDPLTLESALGIQIGV